MTGVGRAGAPPIPDPLIQLGMAAALYAAPALATASLFILKRIFRRRNRDAPGSEPLLEDPSQPLAVQLKVARRGRVELRIQVRAVVVLLRYTRAWRPSESIGGNSCRMPQQPSDSRGMWYYGMAASKLMQAAVGACGALTHPCAGEAARCAVCKRRAGAACSQRSRARRCRTRQEERDNGAGRERREAASAGRCAEGADQGRRH